MAFSALVASLSQGCFALSDLAVTTGAVNAPNVSSNTDLAVYTANNGSSTIMNLPLASFISIATLVQSCLACSMKSLNPVNAMLSAILAPMFLDETRWDDRSITRFIYGLLFGMWLLSVWEKVCVCLDKRPEQKEEDRRGHRAGNRIQVEQNVTAFLYALLFGMWLLSIWIQLCVFLGQRMNQNEGTRRGDRAENRTRAGQNVRREG